MEKINYYELLFLQARPEGESLKDGTLPSVKEVITKNGGQPAYEKGTEKKKLAYAIRRNRHAVFGLVKFSSEPEMLGQIEKDLNLLDGVDRWQIVKKTAVDKSALGRDEEIGHIKPKAGTGFVPRMPETPTVPEPIKPVEEKDKEAAKLDIGKLDEKLEKIIGGEDLIQ